MHMATTYQTRMYCGFDIFILITGTLTSSVCSITSRRKKTGVGGTVSTEFWGMYVTLPCIIVESIMTLYYNYIK